MHLHYVADQMPRHPTRVYPQRARAVVARAVIHHSVTDAAGPELRHCKNIARRHVRIAGWPGIGYHFCIFPSGTVYQVQDLETISHHAAGYNGTSVGICLIGKLHKHAPSAEQLEAAAWLVDLLGWRAVPHKALNATACPGRWAEWGHLITGG